MSWSLNIGRIAGTAVRVHITFLLFLVWIFLASYSAEGQQAAVSSTVFLLLLFACVLAHEFGHIFTARAFGVATPDVTLLPIGGLARLERIPEEPYQELLIAIAGPLVNVAIAIALVLFAGAHLHAGDLYAVESPRVSMLDRLAAVNIFLAVFNMIPAFPMDGGRVLRALLATKLGFVRATGVAAAIGQAVAFGLGFTGLFYNPMLIFIAIFVYLAAASEAHAVAMRTMSQGVPVSTAMMTQYATLTPDAPVEEAVQTLLRTSQSEFPVIDGAGKPIGLLGTQRSVSRAQGTGTGCARRRCDVDDAADREPAPLSRRCTAHPAGEVGARRGGGRHHGPAGRAGHVRDGRRNDDAAQCAAQGREVGAVEQAGDVISPFSSRRKRELRSPLAQ